MNLHFKWEESENKRRHYYVTVGSLLSPAGFVAYQRRGWKAKSYLPGSAAGWWSSKEDAMKSVESYIEFWVRRSQIKYDEKPKG